jgi:gamma-glutamylcyclotransferase (GGCT)/AIG2-like uncharacterized protein YtfP
MPDHFFFYGTLIPQYAPEHLREILVSFHFIGEGWLPGILYDFGNYPGAVFDVSTPAKVCGRVYHAPCDDLLLAEFDRYEGYDQLLPTEGEYIRQRRYVTLASGNVVECWMYDYNWSTDGFPIIAGGRWGDE